MRYYNNLPVAFNPNHRVRLYHGIMASALQRTFVRRPAIYGWDDEQAKDDLFEFREKGFPKHHGLGIYTSALYLKRMREYA